jgi:hypothetical protein
LEKSYLFPAAPSITDGVLRYDLEDERKNLCFEKLSPTCRPANQKLGLCRTVAFSTLNDGFIDLAATMD